MNNTIGAVRDGGVAGGTASLAMPAADSCCPGLSMRDRLYGCIGCFCIGIAVSFLAWLMWITGKTSTFAVLYTIGNLISLFSTCFIMGPKRQARRMAAAKRKIATGIYLSMMVITVVVAFTVKGGGSKVLILMCVFLQWCALIWYVASYIPFGQKLITKFFKSVSSF